MEPSTGITCRLMLKELIPFIHLREIENNGEMKLTFPQ